MVQSIFGRVIKDSAEEAFYVVMSLVLSLLMLVLPYRSGAFAVSFDQAVTPQTQLVTVTLKNNTNREITVAADKRVSFERKTSTGWEAVPKAESTHEEIVSDGFVTVSLWRTLQIQFSPANDFQNPMTPGTYRFILHYRSGKDDRNATQKETFLCEFQVTES